jgi:hypothetical protein
MWIWRRGCRDVTVFTKNRDRLLGGEIASKFFGAVLDDARVNKSGDSALARRRYLVRNVEACRSSSCSPGG